MVIIETQTVTIETGNNGNMKCIIGNTTWKHREDHIILYKLFELKLVLKHFTSRNIQIDEIEVHISRDFGIG